MKKKFKSIFMIVVLCIIYFNNTISTASAVEKRKDSINDNQLKSDEFDKSKKRQYTKKKIDSEKKNKTGILDNEMEQYLNDSGIFDEEICNMDESTIEELKDCDVEDIQVITTFYKLDESVESEDANSNTMEESIESSELSFVEMDKDEINNAIAEVYYDKKIDTESDKSIVDETMKAFGIKPIDVYANANNYNEFDDISTSYVKRTILVVPTKLNGTEYLKILCNYNWMKMPINRLVDTACLSFDDNVKYDDNQQPRINTYAKVMTAYTVYEYRELTGEELSYNCYYNEYNLNKRYFNENNNQTIELYPGQLGITNHNFYACIDLMDDDTEPNSAERKVKKTKVDYVNIILCTYVKRTDLTDEKTRIESFYYHTKSKQNIKIKALKFKTGQNLIDCAMFVLKNANCVSFANYVVWEAGSNLVLNYYFK